jgi:hypothetical protein
MSHCRGCIAAAFLVAAGAGCGPSGPTRYHLSGTVSLDGAPIPAGTVVFTPDAAQKNEGPQGIAEIHDGKYDTRLGTGKGISGGPTIIHVTGFNGAGDQLLCDHSLNADLPRSDATHDIKVPKTGAPKTVKEI